MFLYYDWEMMIGWGRALLDGQYLGVYPLPATALLALLSLVPYQVTGTVVAAASLVVLVVAFKRMAFAWALYLPTLHGLYLGQPDVLLWGLWRAGTPLALALMTLKPHVFLLALPKVLALSRSDKVRLALYTAVMYLPFFVWRPGWVGEWVHNIMVRGRFGSTDSVTLWGSFPLMIMLVIPALMSIRRDTLAHLWPAVCLSVVEPLRVYNLIFLADERAHWLALLSWPVTLAGLWVGNLTGFAIYPTNIMAVLTLVYIVWYNAHGWRLPASPQKALVLGRFQGT